MCFGNDFIVKHLIYCQKFTKIIINTVAMNRWGFLTQEFSLPFLSDRFLLKKSFIKRDNTNKSLSKPNKLMKYIKSFSNSKQMKNYFKLKKTKQKS